MIRTGPAGEPRWDPRADINGDQAVNILDLVLAARNFKRLAPSPWP